MRTLLVSSNSLFAEAMSVCLHANDGIDVIGIAFDPSTAPRAVEVLRPHVVVFDELQSGRPAREWLAECRVVAPDVGAVLLAPAIDPTGMTDAVFDAVVPGDSALDRAVAAVREVARRRVRQDGTGHEVLADPTAGLSGREMEVLRLLAAGASTKDVAARLHLSPHTVRNHVRRVLAKLGVNSRTQAVVEATRRRLV